MHSIDKYLIASVCWNIDNRRRLKKKKKNVPTNVLNRFIRNRDKKEKETTRTTTETVIREFPLFPRRRARENETRMENRGKGAEERSEIKVSGRRWIARYREERPKEGENSREVVCQYGSTAVSRFGFRRQQANEWNSSALKFQTSPGNRGRDVSADARRSKWRVARNDPEFLSVLPILLLRTAYSNRRGKSCFVCVSGRASCSHLRILHLRYLDWLTRSSIRVLGRTYVCTWRIHAVKCQF